MELIISENLTREKRKDIATFRILPFRRLNKSEIAFARGHGLHRYYLPSLSLEQREEFFLHFDEFWNAICKQFDSAHPFWRNVVSSKMQEWELSLAYLVLTLFTLTRTAGNDTRLIIVCRSMEEKAIWRQWAQKCDWSTTGRLGGIFVFVQVLRQWFTDSLLFFKLVLENVRKKYFSPKKRPFPKSHDSEETILIASLFYPSSFKGNQFEDPFLGGFHEFLSKKNRRCMYLSAPLTKSDEALVKTIEACQGVILNMPHSILSWVDLFKVLGRVFFRRIAFKPSQFMGCDFSGILQWNACNFNHNFNVDAEIFYESLKKLCAQQRFDQLIIIYEGNVFERACIQAFREVSHARICGYGHGVIFQLNLKLRITEAERSLRPEPDNIVCTGIYSKKLFMQAGSRRDTLLKNGCSLRFIPHDVQRNPCSGDRERILIALDGVRSAASVLDWLIENKSIFIGYKVCIRTHPNVPITEISKYMIENIPEEFEVSNNDLDVDIKESFCVIYRHTSVGIQALLNGVPVIHLDVDAPLSGDPIEDSSTGKWSVRAAAELKSVLGEMRGFLLSEKQTALIRENEVLQGYFTSPTEEKMYDFLTV